jgi:membrane-associated phospholipid phosphatase
MIGLRIWSIGLLGTVAAVIASYFWLDRPLAHLAHDAIAPFHLFDKLTLFPDAIAPIAVVAIAAIGLRGLTGKPLSRLQSVLLLCGLSLAVADIVKIQLKYAFGRTWPETWTRNNPSFIRDNVYGFFPFHGGAAYDSFPSGHTTAICTVMTVLWLCYPRYRALYALAVATVALGLVGADFHFLSDVIAGAFLGTSVGWISVSLWEIAARRVRPDGETPDANGPS